MLRQFISLKGRKPSSEYINFVKWSFITNVIVSIETALSTSNMLEGISGKDVDSGVRTLNYIGKDIIGQIGGVLYISSMSHKADDDPKRFLMYSNLLQQCSMIALASTPLVPSSGFLVIAGTANILTNISFTGFGAINAKCIQALSPDGTDIGEIYSKLTAVNTAASSIGLAAGVVITTLVPDPSARVALLPVLGIARVYSLDRAVNSYI